MKLLCRILGHKFEPDSLQQVVCVRCKLYDKDLTQQWAVWMGVTDKAERGDRARAELKRRRG